MCSKAAWFRARNSVDRSVAAFLQASASPWRALERRARPLSSTNGYRVKKRANVKPPSALTGVPLRCAWLEVCRWITYIAGRSSSQELRAGRTGPTIKALPWLQTALIVFAYLKIETYRSLAVRPQRKMMRVVRAYEGDVLDGR